MSKASKYLLTTKVIFDEVDSGKVITIWKKSLLENAQIYKHNSDSSLLELREIASLDEIAETLKGDHYKNLKQELKNLLSSDFHQDILEFKENVVAQKECLPSSTYLQMRHIEVPLKRYDEYLEWREKTIFNYVKKLNKIDSFVAYHSLMSASPGVMFVCGFSNEVEKHLADFTTPEYTEIVSQAGDSYISGGEKGLYTEVYKKI